MFTTPDSRAALLLLIVLVASPFAYGIRFIKMIKEWSQLNPKSEETNDE